MDQKKNTSPIQINDLKVVWRLISRNWYIPLILGVVFYTIGTFYVYKLENIYEVSVELLKTHDTYYEKSVITDGGGFYGGAAKSYVDNSNEIRIITSYDIMEESVTKLKKRLQVSYFIVGRVRTTEQFSGMPFNVEVNSVNSFLFENPIDLKILNEKEYELKYQKAGAEVVKKGEFNKELIDLDFNISVNSDFHILKSEQYSKLNYQMVIHDLDRLISRYKNSLSVKNPDYTNVLVISMSDILPERAKLILDTLSRIYINKSMDLRFDINERTVSFIDKQLDEIGKTLKVSEDTMQNYKEQKAILDLDWEKNDYFEKLSSFDAQNTRLNLKIDALNDLEKYIIEDKDPQFLPPNVYLVDNDGFLTSSVNELYGSQLELSTAILTSTEVNPNIIKMREKLKSLKQNMLVYINNSRNATYKIIENVKGEMNSYIGQIKGIPRKQREMLGMSRQVSVNEALYNFLLQKKASTKIARASIVPDIRIIDSPRNKGVVSPDKKKIITTYVTIGLAISLGIILIRLFFFTTIQSVDELKEITSLSVIADLPFQKDVADKGFVVDYSPNSYISEAFRTLRTNLQYVILDSGKKTILVTSNAPGEGKTFTSINLGALLAKSGKKVVMLELDLHKPRIQKALEMNADIGISTFMLGNNTLQDIVKPTVIPNLFAILSGPIPPNPSELILSEKLKEIINFSKENFDYVIIDTPPAGLLTDAAYMMQYADIKLFVLNTKFAHKQAVKSFEKIVFENSIKDIYLILNGVKRRRTRYYYSRYGYGYGYGYSYGYGYGYSKKS